MSMIGSGGGGYAPLPGGEINDDLLEPSNAAFIWKLTQKAKKGAKIGLSVGGTLAGVAGLTSPVEVRSVYKTHKHIGKLESIKSMQTCTCGSCNDVLDYALTQKKLKRKRRVISAIPVVSTYELVRSKGHALLKTHRGERRRQMAADLYWGAKEGCTMAQAIVMELCNTSDHKDVTDIPNGWEIIAAKLAST